MAENPYVNKVELADGTVLIDISGDTVSSTAMISGYTAHSKSGEQITGVIPVRSSGYIGINDSAGTVTVTSGYYSNETKNLNAGTITNNTTLPSGKTSSGTVNRGSYIKIGRGHYKSDTYYKAQENSGILRILASGNTSVSGYEYAQVLAGTITNNTSLPSGKTSSGTVSRGTYIKIGSGFYNSDLYYQAQASSGTKSITHSGTTDVDGYAYASVEAGDITNNTTLPSGSTSSGTVNFGEYIKVGAGFYNSDTYYQAKDRQLSYDSEIKHLTMTY